MATCPECDAEIEIDEDDLAEMEVGDPWSCDACGSGLRVASLVPLEFDGDEDEDEDDDDDEDEVKVEAEEDELDDDEDEDDADKDGDWEE